MSGFYSGRQERERKERDTPERIEAIARAKGEFRVSLRFRDDWLRKRCFEMRDAGVLVGGKRRDRELVFYPAQLSEGAGE